MKIVYLLLFSAITTATLAQEAGRITIPLAGEIQVEPPEKKAEVIVRFVASVDMPLHIPSERDVFLQGNVTAVERGEGPINIVIPAQSIIRPLEQGKEYKIYLLPHPRLDAHYPIGIIPANTEAQP